MVFSPYNQGPLKDRRKELRKNQTEAESLLWDKLRNKRLDAYKFFRQYSVGPYILDFYCPLLRLAIELDGAHHNDAKEYDKERDFFLDSKGIQTVRFWNNEVLSDMDGVLKKIMETANSINKTP